MFRFFYQFVKWTGFPAALFGFRTKYSFADRRRQGRLIKGPMIVVSNHTAIMDFAALMYTFRFRVLRTIASEAIFKNKRVNWFYRAMGLIKVDRYNHDFAFLDAAQRILEKKGVVLVFPESRLPNTQEIRAGGLPFTNGATYLALKTQYPILPVFLKNVIGKKKGRTKISIGTPFYLKDYLKEEWSEKEAVQNMTALIREKVFGLAEIQK